MSRIIVGGLDIETTGLKQEEGHRIVEVALSMHRLEAIDAPPVKVGDFVRRINPERGIDPAAQAVHGIAFEDLIGQPRWPEVGGQLSALMSRCDVIVAHNGEGFDCPFIVRELMRAGLPVPKIAVTDTMLQGRWATPDGMPPSLRALAFACGVEYDESKAHAALYDVEVMLACFFQQLPRGFFQLPTRPWELPKPEAKSK